MLSPDHTRDKGFRPQSLQNDAIILSSEHLCATKEMRIQRILDLEYWLLCDRRLTQHTPNSQHPHFGKKSLEFEEEAGSGPQEA